MIQQITKQTFKANWGFATQYGALQGGTGTYGADWPDSSTFGANACRVPISVGGTFLNFVVNVIGTHPAMTLTVWKNNAATSLSVSISATDTTGSDTTHSFTATAGDDIVLKLVGSVQSFPGYEIAWCLELDADAVGASTYAIPPSTANITAGTGIFGGAFGNGQFQLYNAALADSNTYSISSLDGTVTRLDLIAWDGAPGTSSWLGYLRKNGVLQDGTGGTVDTTATITGSATSAFSTFSLAVAKADHFDVVIIRTGTGVSSGTPHVAASVAVTSSVDNVFMVCGGSNNSVSTSADGWQWNCSQQLVAESGAQVPVGPRGLIVTGLYVEHSKEPGVGSSWVDSFRKNGVTTAIVVTVADLATTGLDVGSVASVSGDLINVQTSPANTPQLAQFHYGLSMTTNAAAPARTYTTQTRVIRRLRRGPHVASQGYRIFHNRFLLDLQPGIGNVVDPGQVPQVMLRWSNNGGQTWSNEHWMSAGELGHYFKRLHVDRLGQARDRVYEVVVSDPVAWTLIGAFLDVEQGTN